MQKHILFTFDHELFLGQRSGTAENCMLSPGNRLRELFRRFGLKNAIFFVDTTYLMALREQAQAHQRARADWALLQDQLRSFEAEGHYVFPHIHPHWLDAAYNETTNQWALNNLEKYRFHALSKAEKTKVFEGSIQILKDILGAEARSVKEVGFRAGGWCIQPFSDFRPCFEAHRIRYEFSVLRGFRQFTNAQFIDFMEVPEKEIYQFSDNVVQEDPEGPFTQITISGLEIPKGVQLSNRVLEKIHWKLNIRSLGDGQGVIPKAVAGPNGKTSSSLPNRERMAIELMNAVKLPLYKKYLANNKFLHFISHPKMLSAHHFKIFERFLNHLTSNYEVETDFKQMLPS